MSWKFWKSSTADDLARVRAVTEALSGDRECSHVGHWRKWEKTGEGKLSRGSGPQKSVVGDYERQRRECELCGAAELRTISTFNLREDQEKYGQGYNPGETK